VEKITGSQYHGFVITSILSMACFRSPPFLLSKPSMKKLKKKTKIGQYHGLFLLKSGKKAKRMKAND